MQQYQVQSSASHNMTSSTTHWLAAAAAAVAADVGLSTGSVVNARSLWPVSPGRQFARDAEFPVSFAIIVVGSSFIFVAVIGLLILASSTTSSSYRGCCRASRTSAVRTAPAAAHSSSHIRPEPRLVGFATARPGPGDVSTGRRAEEGAQSNGNQMRLEPADSAGLTTAARVHSAYREQTDNDDIITRKVNCMGSRSVSVPAIVDFNRNHRPLNSRPHITVDRHDGALAAVRSARVDSGVSGMQSSIWTVSSSVTQPPPSESCLGAGQEADWYQEQCADDTAGESPVWNLSQLSMDVRSCPGGTSDRNGITLQPPLYLYQYINGYSDAMLIHTAEQSGGQTSWQSSDVRHAPSTTTTHSDDDRETRWYDAADTGHGAQSIQITAIIETSRRTSNHEPESVCGQSDDPLTPPLCTYLPVPDISPPSDKLQLPTSARDRPSTPTTDRVDKLTTDQLQCATNSSYSDADRRRQLTRLLLGQCRYDDLTPHPALYEETYF